MALKLSREIKTALLVIFGIIFLYFGYNFLKKQSVFESNVRYKTTFDYNALTISSPVTIKGNPIGKIESIDYNFQSGKTDVTFTVDKRLKFPKNSVVRLYEEGLLGGSAMAIIPGDGTTMAADNDFIPSEVEQGLVDNLAKNFSGLGGDLETTLKSADTLMLNLNSLLTDDSDKGLKNVLAELNATLRSFKTLSRSLNNVVATNDQKIASLLDNFNTISADFKVVSNNLKQADLNQTISNLDTTLNNFNGILADLDKGEGSIGKLLKDEGLYNNLKGATKELEELLRDIKLHPKRYFRILSKKEIPYKKD